MGAILGLLASALSLGLKVWGWFSGRSDQQAGADAQTSRNNAVSATAESAIAQAEANSPKTDDEVDQRLRGHSL